MRRQQGTPSRLEDAQRIQILNRKRHHARRQRADLALQATRHVLGRDLIHETDKVVGIQTEQAVRDAHDARAAGAERVEVVDLAGVAAQQHGAHAVHGDEVLRDVGEGQRGQAVVPVVEDALAAGGNEGAAALLGAEEAADEVQGRRAGVAGEVGEEAEEEAGGAVEEDDLGAVVKVWVLRDRLLVPHPHEVDHLGEVEVAPDGVVHHLEEGPVEGEVVGLLEEEVAAGEGGVGFEFLGRVVVRALGGLGEGEKT